MRATKFTDRPPGARTAIHRLFILVSYSGTAMTTVSASSGLDAALSASLRGAQGAAERFARAAGRIAAAGTETARAPDPVPARPGGPDLLATQEAVDVPGELIQARMAQRAYEANLAVMKRAAAMERDALDLLG